MWLHLLPSIYNKDCNYFLFNWNTYSIYNYLQSLQNRIRSCLSKFLKFKIVPNFCRTNVHKIKTSPWRFRLPYLSHYNPRFVYFYPLKHLLFSMNPWKLCYKLIAVDIRSRMVCNQERVNNGTSISLIKQDLYKLFIYC